MKDICNSQHANRVSLERRKKKRKKRKKEKGKRECMISV